MYGPKGIGALYVAKRDPAIDLEALIDGGGHERGYRSGTLNVPAIVGFGSAAELCGEAPARMRRACTRCAIVCGRALSAVDGIHVNGPMEPRLPNNLNVRVDERARRVVVEGDRRRRRCVVRRSVRDRERRAVARTARHGIER